MPLAAPAPAPRLAAANVLRHEVANGFRLDVSCHVHDALTHQNGAPSCSAKQAVERINPAALRFLPRLWATATDMIQVTLDRLPGACTAFQSGNGSWRPRGRVRRFWRPERAVSPVQQASGSRHHPSPLRTSIRATITRSRGESSRITSARSSAGRSARRSASTSSRSARFGPFPASLVQALVQASAPVSGTSCGSGWLEVSAASLPSWLLRVRVPSPAIDAKQRQSCHVATSSANYATPRALRDGPPRPPVLPIAATRDIRCQFRTAFLHQDGHPRAPRAPSWSPRAKRLVAPCSEPAGVGQSAMS